MKLFDVFQSAIVIPIDAQILPFGHGDNLFWKPT